LSRSSGSGATRPAQLVAGPERVLFRALEHDRDAAWFNDASFGWADAAITPHVNGSAD